MAEVSTSQRSSKKTPSTPFVPRLGNVLRDLSVELAERGALIGKHPGDFPRDRGSLLAETLQQPQRAIGCEMRIPKLFELAPAREQRNECVFRVASPRKLYDTEIDGGEPFIEIPAESGCPTFQRARYERQLANR